MSKITIRALVLDFGGVISLPQRSENVKNILQTLNIEHDEFMQVYLYQRRDFDQGRIRAKQFWLNVLDELGLESENGKIPYLIREDITSWTTINDLMIQFISENRGKFYKTALLSNMPIDVLEYMRKEFRWLELFDQKVFSCEVGVNKPDHEIYETCLNALNIPADDCLFVDDALENVRAALALDMHAVQFRTFPDFVDEFNQKFNPSPD
jgi:putative hydrolase of the HAD superfamily